MSLFSRVRNLVDFDGTVYRAYQVNDIVSSALAHVGGALQPTKARPYHTIPALPFHTQRLSKLPLTWTPEAAAKGRLLLVEANERKSLSKAVESDLDMTGFQVQLRPYQKAGVEYMMRAKRVLLGDGMRVGKAQPLTANLATPTGWIKMRDVQIGMVLLNERGEPCTITGVFPQGLKDIYRVTFTDGSRTECCDEHLWSVRTAKDKYKGSGFQTRSLNHIRQQLHDNHGNTKWFIPVALPLQLPTAELPIPPYLLGALIGDGCLSGRILFSSADYEILKRVEWQASQMGLTLSYRSKYDYQLTYRQGVPNPLRLKLKALGLTCKADKKHIPSMYLRADAWQRLELLRGLLDTDGFINKTGTAIQFTSMSPALINDVIELVQTLGGVSYRTGKSHTISISLPEECIPFHLSRKQKRLRTNRTYLPYRGIANVELIGHESAQCIAVDSPSHLYLTDELIVTHNTFQALGLMFKEQCFPALVICLVSNKYDWQKQAGLCMPDKNVVVLDSKFKPLEVQMADICIVNYNLLAAGWETPDKKQVELSRLGKALMAHGFKSIFLDEIQACKNRSTQTSKACRKLAEGKLIRVGMTGTPVTNNPAELVPLLQILGRLNDMGGYMHFMKRYCQSSHNKFNQFAGSHNETELHERMRASFYIRRTLAEIADEMPPLTRSVVVLDIDNRDEYVFAEKQLIAWVKEQAEKDKDFLAKIAHLSADLQAELIEQHKSDKAARAKRAEAMVRVSALKRITARGKLAAARRWVDDQQISGEKLVLFATGLEILGSLRESYPEAAAVVSDMNDKERHAQVATFQDGDCSLLIGAMGTSAGSSPAGVGLTMSSADCCAVLEMPWTSTHWDQLEARIQAVDKTRPCSVYALVARDTIESKILKILDTKRLITSAITDGKVDTTSPPLIDLLMEELAI